MSTGNKYVDAMGEISFEGNIIPMEWFKHVRLKDGKPDTVAIILLSEIVYWYRPAIDRDERSGEILRYRKRFKADLLQKSYRDLADTFGLTVREAEKALTRLERDYSLIQRDCRKSVKTEHGLLGNVLFIKPNVANIRVITHPHTPLVPQQVLAPTHPGRTYTEITTENTLGFTPIVPVKEKDVAAEDSLPYSTTPEEVARGGEEEWDAASQLREEADQGRENLGEVDGDHTSSPPLLAFRGPQRTRSSATKTPELDTETLRKPKRDIQHEAEVVLAHLNRITGKRLTSTGLIPARLQEGRTVDDCTLVCDWILATWSKDYAERSVNYETPFRARKFELYLDSAQRWGWTQQPKTPSPPPSPAALTPAALPDDLMGLINTTIPERSPHAPR